MSHSPAPAELGRLDRLVTAYALLSESRGPLLLALIGGLAAVGLALAPRIAIDPRLEALLPPDTPHQRALREAVGRFASEAPMYFVISSSDPALNRRLQAQILEGVGAWPETIWAISRRDPTYFLDRRLLYVPAADLDALAEQTEALLTWDRCAASPGCFSLEPRPPPPDFASLRTRYEAIPEVSTLITLFGADALPDPEAATGLLGPGPDTRGAAPGPLGELCDRTGNVCVVMAFMSGDSSDLAYATAMLEKGEALLGSVRPAGAPAELVLSVAGRYRNVPSSARDAGSDLARTSWLALGLVLVVLLLQFRGPRAIAMLLLPLAATAGIGAGLLALFHPRLNLISAAMLPVLVGIGDDFGLHLCTEYGGRRRAGASPVEAVTATLRQLLVPLLGAALTCCLGFLALCAADFRGFAEVGALAALGIALTVIVAIAAFPPLALSLHRLRPESVSPVRQWRFLGWLSRPQGRRRALATTCAGLAVAVAAVWLGGRVRYEDDYRSLSRRSMGVGANYGPALHGTDRLVVLMLADDASALEAAAAELRATSGPEKGTRPAWILTPGLFVPAGQEERLAALGRLRAAVDDTLRYLEGDAATRLTAWRPLLAPPSPIRREDFPPWVVNTFSERDGTLGRIGILYTTGNGAHAGEMAELSRDIGAWQARFPAVRFASAPALLGEVVPRLRADTPLVVGLAALGLLLGTLVIGRSAARTALVLLPVGLSMAAVLVVMGAAGWSVHLYNLLVFPLALGLGVDGALFVVWALWRGRRAPLAWNDLAASAQAVTASTLTTIAGFLGLVASTNLGVRSLGLVGTLAVGLSMIANLLWLPSLMSLLRHGTGAPGGEPR